MSDGEAPPAGPDVSDAVDESEIKNELNEDWWYLPIKQEEDLDSATFSYPVLNVAPWVCVSAFQLYTDKETSYRNRRSNPSCDFFPGSLL